MLPEPYTADEAMHWRECLQHFLQHALNKSGARETYIRYKGILTRFFGIDFTRNPNEVSTADVEAFVNGPSVGTIRTGQPVAQATKNSRLAAIASFYKYATTYTYADAHGQRKTLLRIPSPTIGIAYGKPARSHRYLTLEEMERLFAVIPTDTVKGLRDRAIFNVFFWSARRRSEIVRLRRGDFSRVIFQDGRTGWQYRFFGKGKQRREDYAEMPEDAMRAIFRYLQADGRDWDTMRPDEAIFYAVAPPQGGGVAWGKQIPLTGQGMLRVLKSYAREANLDSGIVIHSFRHTAARERYLATHDIIAIKSLLRHERLDTTFNYVMDMIPTEDTQAAKLHDTFGKFSE